MNNELLLIYNQVLSEQVQFIVFRIKIDQLDMKYGINFLAQVTGYPEYGNFYF